eukprot:5037794-Alexandrium_andersonii.AAC.1
MGSAERLCSLWWNSSIASPFFSTSSRPDKLASAVMSLFTPARRSSSEGGGSRAARRRRRPSE